MNPSRRRGAGLRLRITIAFVGAALAVSALVAGTTYALAERYLVRQRVDDALQQSLSNVRFASQFLAAPAEEELEGELEEEELEGQLSELVDLLEARGTVDAMIVRDTTPIASSITISLDSLPPGLRNAVEGGRVGYTLTGAPRRMVFGSPVPNQGLEAY
ncbi:MAG: hypothetical protein ACRDHJ_10440, partial [Actinomycetota bacterium]